MVEIPGPSENLGKSPGGDRRHSRLLADFLFAGKEEGADSALDRLRVDNNRRSLGMTEQERGTAEVLDWAKENGSGIAREGAMIVGPAVLTAAVWEAAPQSHRAVETAVVSGLGVGTLMTMGGEVVRRIAELYPRFSKFAEGAAVVRSVGLVFTQISASAGIGMVGAELADRFREAFKLSAAAQMGQPEIGGIGRVGGLPPDERSVSPSAPVAGGGEYNPPFTGPNVPPAGGNIDVSPGLPGGGEGGGIDSAMKNLVNSLPTEQAVANLPVDQQVGASHWTLGEQWGRPLAEQFHLSPAGRTFFTDAIKDITQDQGGISPFGSPINYDKAQIGAYLQSAIGRIRDLPLESMQVKVTPQDIEGLDTIAGLLVGS